MRITALFTAFLLLLFAAGGVSAVTITDDLGVTVTIENPPERIVSLSPANSEILFALGLDEKIVGVTEYCTYPEAALSKEKIGGFSTVNIKRFQYLILT
ncbi:MAG: hypothetical protein IKY77_06010 [Methanocorpusculaceae archaeon]|nr:hypothetical protein [Methanocorpusculaceae archaeon]